MSRLELNDVYEKHGVTPAPDSQLWSEYAGPVLSVLSVQDSEFFVENSEYVQETLAQIVAAMPVELILSSTIAVLGAKDELNL